MPSRQRSARRAQARGMAAVELAMVIVPFMVLVMAVPELCKLVWAWNAANEATHVGARTAAVCDLDAPGIKKRMLKVMPWLEDSQISVTYERPGTAACTAAGATACLVARVAVSNYQQTLNIPLLPAVTVPMPPFETTLPREIMDSSNNPACT